MDNETKLMTDRELIAALERRIEDAETKLKSNHIYIKNLNEHIVDLEERILEAQRQTLEAQRRRDAALVAVAAVTRAAGVQA